MQIKSPAFQNNGMIPKKYTGFGEDLSPELILTDVPERTASVAIILDDLDVPFMRTFTHWIIWNIAPCSSVPQGLPGGRTLEKPIGAVQGRAWGKHVYRGPKQPSFIRKAHRYRFTAYALDTMLAIPASAGRSGLIRAMSGHIIGTAETVGVYDPAG